ncbi:LADA_0F06744g1_1 [Lachancea dasiensis]|uniref:LADA_0F06744g1_1 n=1 Tax=Lachancea dasiensis TaxID=1072105 RepID=A0A1G4JKG3_9SACH|nr:LADA_0F06744g1_1 [Lachancea dasiensis]
MRFGIGLLFLAVGVQNSIQQGFNDPSGSSNSNTSYSSGLSTSSGYISSLSSSSVPPSSSFFPSSSAESSTFSFSSSSFSSVSSSATLPSSSASSSDSSSPSTTSAAETSFTSISSEVSSSSSRSQSSSSSRSQSSSSSSSQSSSSSSDSHSSSSSSARPSSSSSGPQSTSSTSSSSSSASSSTADSSVSSTTDNTHSSTTPPASTTSKQTLTTMINGRTVVSTVYYTATSTAGSKGSENGGSGLSKKNRNIVIGCVVGIGVPILLGILAFFYFFCIRSKKTNFINSEGHVVTAYKQNKLTRWWYALMGKSGRSEYEGDSPIGGTSELDDDNNGPGDRSNGVSRNPTDGRGSHSNELMLDEEKYYDEHGNELNARNY